MGSASQATYADRDLSVRLAARGIRVEPRWLHQLRSANEIPGPVLVRSVPGTGTRGGLYRYTTEAEDYAAEKLRLLRLRHNLTAVNLAQFGAGSNPDIRALKRAYHMLFRSLQRLHARGQSARVTALDTAESAVEATAPKLMHSDFTREMVNRVRRRTRAQLPARVRRNLEMPEETPASPADTVKSAITQTVVVALSGATSSPEALGDFIDASGMGATSEDRWMGLGPISPLHPSTTITQVFKRATLAGFDRRIGSASAGELIEARNASALFISFILDARIVIRFLTPLPDAFGFALLNPALVRRAGGRFGVAFVIGMCVPVMLIISDLFPTQYRESLVLMSDNAPRYRAMASCVESLPAEYQRVNGGRRLRRLPQDAQRRLIRDWAIEHPEQALILDIDPGRIQV
jgi:hypothetical protein